MGTGPKKWTEELIARRFREGRGLGDGDEYSPWLNVQEFSSRGVQTRVPSLLFDRTIHTFSYLELALYLVHEYYYGSHLLQYKEQFPIDRRITLGAAEYFGIRHPRYPKTRVPVVMTLDAFTEVLGPGGRPLKIAWDVKPSKALTQKRPMEKLTLHRAYCCSTDVPHQIFTEKSFTKPLVNNIMWLRGSLPKVGEIEVVPGLLTVHSSNILQDLRNHRPRQSIANYCAGYDRYYRLPLGSALRALKVLIWRRDLVVDLTVKRVELEPVPAPDAPLALPHVLRAA